MAKSSKAKNRESETTRDSTKSESKTQDQSSQKSKTSKRKKVSAAARDCCAALLDVPTGSCAMLWRDGQGFYHALVASTTPGVEKVVACDSNGFYLKNP